MKHSKKRVPNMPEGYAQVTLGEPIEPNDLLYWADGWREAKEHIGHNVRMGLLVVRREKNNGGNQ